MSEARYFVEHNIKQELRGCRLCDEKVLVEIEAYEKKHKVTFVCFADLLPMYRRW